MTDELARRPYTPLAWLFSSFSEQEKRRLFLGNLLLESVIIVFCFYNGLPKMIWKFLEEFTLWSHLERTYISSGDMPYINSFSAMAAIQRLKSQLIMAEVGAIVIRISLNVLGLSHLRPTRIY